MKISFIILLMTCLHYLAVCQLSDTINKVDANNMKQGYWIKFDNTKTIKVEEGKFVDDKKEGIWITYYADGKIKSEITYVKGKPDGYARIYYQNGNLSEEGDWKGTKWVGNYKFYYENGSTQYEWSYNNTGKRTGEQKYYHDNGNLMITGEWIDGKENGVIKEYNEKGVLIAEKSFNNGTLDPASVKDYEHPNITDKNNSKDNADTPPNNGTKTNEEVTNKEPKDSALRPFDGNGYHKLYKDGRLDREGEFRDAQLIDGKRFYYDASGKIERTCIYKNGRVVDIIYSP